MVARSWVIDPLKSALVDPRDAGLRLVADDEEDRDREHREQHAGHEEDGIGALGDAQQEQGDGGEDRAHVADPDADPRQPAARRRTADHRERGVVVDQRGLVGEVGDREQDGADDGRRGTDDRRRHDGEHREQEQERHAPAVAVRQRAEERRDEGVDAHADGDRDALDQLAEAGAEAIVGREPQADGGGHDGVREDRVREVVDRPATLGDLALVARIGRDGLGLGFRIGGGLHGRIIGTAGGRVPPTATSTPTPKPAPEPAPPWRGTIR